MVYSKSDVTRFKSHVRVAGECWVWVGRLNDHGYGEFKQNGVKHRAHRWIYQVVNGDLPRDIVLDHLCRNRACVRLSHLEATTAEENIRRGTNRRGR